MAAGMACPGLQKVRVKASRNKSVEFDKQIKDGRRAFRLRRRR